MAPTRLGVSAFVFANARMFATVTMSLSGEVLYPLPPISFAL